MEVENESTLLLVSRRVSPVDSAEMGGECSNFHIVCFVFGLRET